MKKTSLIIVLALICGGVVLAGCVNQPPATPQTTLTPSPASTPVPVPDSISVANNPQLGSILVDANGRTLYHFMRDMPGNGTSACYNQCITIWPVFYAPQVRVSPPLNPLEFGTITRTTGEQQTTYKGWPLYYYGTDTSPGDVKGQGFGGIWFVVSLTGSLTTATTAVPTTVPPTTPPTTVPVTITTTQYSYYY